MFRFLDQELKCSDCGEAFIWSAGEQEFYAVMGFGNDPKRCPTCRRTRRYGGRRPHVQHEVVCAACGRQALVPFVPKGDRPVYCHECFVRRNTPVEAA